MHKPSWLDDTGGLADEVVRDSYGVRVDPTTEPVAYGYTGHAEDPTGLVWGRARYLDPETGAWLSVDPVETEPRYGYVWGRPTWAVDPDGRTAGAQYTLAGALISCEAAVVGMILTSAAVHGGNALPTSGDLAWACGGAGIAGGAAAYYGSPLVLEAIVAVLFGVGEGRG